MKRQPKPTAESVKSPLAKARDEFLESDEGLRLIDGAPSGKYLRNRIELAFLKGVEYGSLSSDKPTPFVFIEDPLIAQVMAEYPDWDGIKTIGRRTARELDKLKTEWAKVQKAKAKLSKPKP